MFKRYRFIFLALILISYSLLYIATSRKLPCDADCEAVYSLDTSLRNGRTYIYNTTRCYRPVISDSICIWVKDTSGIDWNLLADTVCQLAADRGLLQQKIFILKASSTGISDTIIKRQCP